MVDRNLFLHDLAIVAICKNEAPYLKEWIDYHLIAGVDHFYLYDNDSPDNQAEVAKPYVEAGIVDYFNAPGKVMQCAAYNDAIKRFKFHCRYMAFIDGDEFIFPRTGGVLSKPSTKFCHTTNTRRVLRLTGNVSAPTATKMPITQKACSNALTVVPRTIGLLRANSTTTTSNSATRMSRQSPTHEE